MTLGKRWLCAATVLVILLVALMVVFSKTENSEDASVPTELWHDGQITLYNVESICGRDAKWDVTETQETTAVEGYEGLCSRELLLGDIPLLEVWKEGLGRKPLLLFLPGVTCDKESVMMALAAYAEEGYFAVSMDAFCQGARRQEKTWCDNWAAMLITVSDIDRVVEYYDGVWKVRATDFVLGGFSLGAIETWVYVQQRSYRPGVLLTLCGICEYAAWQPWSGEMLAYSWLVSWGGRARVLWGFQPRRYTEEKLQSIAELDISRHMEAYKDLPIFFCVGDRDWYFRAYESQRTMERLAVENPLTVCRIYARQGHELTGEMIDESVAFLRNVCPQ